MPSAQDPAAARTLADRDRRPDVPRPWWRREIGRVGPWVRVAEGALGVVFLVAVVFPLIPRAVAAPIERTLALRLPAPLGAYPDVEALGKVAHEQLAGPKPGYPTLLWASRSFRGDTNGWEWMRIGADGRKGTGRELWNYARQGGSSPYLGQAFDARSVQSLLDRLGPSVSSPPPIDRALFVSFWREGRWTTRLYDRDAPPSVLIDAEALVSGDAARRPESRAEFLWMLRKSERPSGR